MSFTTSSAFQTRETFYAVNKLFGKKSRCMKEDDGRIFVFRKRSRKYGTRYNAAEFDTQFFSIAQKSEQEKWKCRIKKAIRILEKSGLWPNLLVTFKSLQEIGWDGREELKKVQWEKDTIKLQYLSRKYPAAFDYAADGTPQLNRNYVAEASDCQLKSMYFGEENAFIKGSIRHALETKTPYHRYRVRVGYDVSYEYIPEKNRAWYEEEYRDCGNGHYYLALDENTALFYEND